MVKVQIRKSTDPKKKLMAIFTENGKKIKTTHFGAAGMDDFTKTRDEAQKKRYLDRHRKRENWSAPKTAGALSRWILWNKPTRAASIADFKRRFNLQ
tara:strand:- start:187 stop:477 length:291 start_codon:yes stop_codon:yes gene_type:complete